MKRIINHLVHFYPIWLVMLGVLLASYCLPWNCMQDVIKWLMVFFVAIIVLHPLNVVYGLIGTKGSISLYVFLMIVINLIFSGIYHYAIFKDAGITYDINQPYISYNLFVDKTGTTATWPVEKDVDTVKVYNHADSLFSYWLQPKEEHKYQKIDCWYVLRNTFMTSLMQEPSDFFAIASTYNESVDDFPDTQQIGKEKSELFHWLLILQVFISWIFFGVFISILYNKFRYES